MIFCWYSLRLTDKFTAHAMSLDVFALRHNFEIRRIVVMLIMILVMNDFAFSKRPPEHLFSDYPVLMPPIVF